jgi:hypothetical protein
MSPVRNANHRLFGKIRSCCPSNPVRYAGGAESLEKSAPVIPVRHRLPARTRVEAKEGETINDLFAFLTD